MSNSVRPHRRQPTRLLCPWDSPGKNTGVGCHFHTTWVLLYLGNPKPISLTSSIYRRRRQWQPTPVLLPGKSHGWRILVGCSPWSREESDRTEWLHFHFSLSCIGEGNGNPLQYSCLENPRDGGAWWAAVYGVAQSRTWLKRLSSSSSSTYRRGTKLYNLLETNTDLDLWAPPLHETELWSQGWEHSGNTTSRELGFCLYCSFCVCTSDSAPAPIF